MDIGIAKEIAAGGLERRAVLLPEEVKELIKANHRVFVEKGLGERIYIADEDYWRVGATVCQRKTVMSQSIVVKLKAPLPEEFGLLGDNLLFCMLHAEQNPHYLEFLRKRNVTSIAMEIIRNEAQERLVECTHISGEQGMLMAFNLAEKSPTDCNILVLGYGAIAAGALKVANGLGAQVKILRKREYKYMSSFVKNKDIIVNGIEWPKEQRQQKEYLITQDMLALLNKGGIILDLSADYPNPIETCRPSFLDDPVYTVSGIKHISLYGYPGMAPLSSARRYSKQVLPLLLEIASSSLEDLPKHLKDAILTFPEVSQDLEPQPEIAVL